MLISDIMRKLPYILGIVGLLFVNPSYGTNQQDSTFNQVVTVERDYQPEIESASMIQIKPTTLQVEVDLNPVIYSTYSTPLSIGYNLHPLQAAELRFTPLTPTTGLLDVAIGHHNTHVNFDYQLHGDTNTTANFYAKHDAYWGSNTLSHTKIGGHGDYCFKKSKLYFGLDGANSAYTLRGQKQLQALYHAFAYIGLHSNNAQDYLQYNAQIAYKAFFTPAVIENQVRSHLNISWGEGQHRGGIDVHAQNNIYCSTSQSIEPIHNLRMEPFYELEEGNFNLHVGVNLDLNIGTEQMLSKTNNISFAPSPNVKFEWNIVPEKLQLHTLINGSFAKGNIDESLHINRYFNIAELVTKRDAKTYIPVASKIGFVARPLRTLLIDIYGGYSLYMNDYTMVANLDKNISYEYILQNYQCGHVGAALHYHYRDIVNIKANGNYYFWKNLSSKSTVYDRPEWDATLSVKVNIDQKWSIYSENRLEGARMAYTTMQDEQLPMTIDLNIGAEYDINRWINVYLQLGNYLNRKNPIYYGYNTQGCHFLAGFKYTF